MELKDALAKIANAYGLKGSQEALLFSVAVVAELNGQAPRAYTSADAYDELKPHPSFLKETSDE